MPHARKTTLTPVGRLTLIASERGLAAVLWENEDRLLAGFGSLIENPDHPILVETERQLREYFDGHREQFNLPLDATGTPFQRDVWAALSTIPFGETRSYVAIARQIGRPLAMRAVGAANGRNPISIIVPCHRVIGANGTLTGFGGGLPIKAQLLALEAARRPVLAAAA